MKVVRVAEDQGGQLSEVSREAVIAICESHGHTDVVGEDYAQIWYIHKDPPLRVDSLIPPDGVHPQVISYRDFETSVERRTAAGGTARSAVLEQVALLKAWLAKTA